MKRVLITGSDSYIGESTRDYLRLYPNKYIVDIKSTIGWNPEPKDFISYDVVFNVAGIAHVKETQKNRHLYYNINRDLAIKIAISAKDGGVKQFILLSTMSVYGLTVGYITKNMETNPITAYGKSKVEADDEIKKLEDRNFKVACIRPPMVYGKDCKGNYQKLRRFALQSLIFPDFENKRSMIYIGNLCEFVRNCIDQEKSGIFFPQNAEYVNTSEMVRLVGLVNGHKIRIIKGFNPLIKLLENRSFMDANKVFGSLVYEKEDIVFKYSFEDSIALTESQIV